MNRLMSLALFCLLLTSVSCRKEEVNPSNAELIARELQSVISENKIERVMNFETGQSWATTMILGEYGKNYRFQGQFIFIEGESFNLNNLIKYKIAQKEEVKFLLLTFY